jgi:hypothetical protein
VRNSTLFDPALGERMRTITGIRHFLHAEVNCYFASKE